MNGNEKKIWLPIIQYHRILKDTQSKYSLKTLNGFKMRWLVFLALSVIISYAANGAKPSNLSNNQTPLPTDCKQPSPNVTEVCDNALKNMEKKLEKLIANKLEKLLKQNLETKLEKLTATCQDAFKRVESKLKTISVQSHKTLLSGTVSFNSNF